MSDSDTGLGQEVRLQKAAEACRAVGMSALKTEYTLTTSIMETGCHWMIDDANGIYSPGCTRLFVGMEFADRVIDKAWSIPAVRELCVQRGLTDQNGNWNSLARQFNAEAVKFKNRAFEYVIDARAAPLLTHFSIGPTMCHMRMTGPELYGDPLRAGFPASWDELYNYYMAVNRLVPAKVCNTYLREPRPEDTDQSQIDWLVFQTGNPNIATQYHDGVGLWAATNGGWRAKLDYVRKVVPQQ